ncbi:hypothetical protein ACI2LJ_27670 [Streptomyces sp. NPDC088090]|uniref:hypothetical protein n=1 Tax=Streptomyces sp. NPDC088090 TaxID=3365822 RepID=UPI00384C1D75
MTDQPTFEYRDEDGDYLTARPAIGALTSAILLRTGHNPVCVALDRVEELVAGIRDAARTAARQTTGQDDTGPTPCSVPVACEPGGEPCDRHEREQAHAEGEHELCGAECPAVGQPAEAHDTGVWTPANLHFLRFALGCAAAVMYSEDDFTDEDYAALDQLRAFAGPSPEDQTFEARATADTVEDPR